MAAIAIFIGACPFQLYKEPYINQFIIEASDRVYYLPGQCLISGELLEQQYQELEKRIEVLIYL